jgi:hypothetical protein
MRRIHIAFVLAVVVGCGAEGPNNDTNRQRRVQADVPENRPPEIVEAYLAPEEPSRNDTLRLMLEVRDPDRDGVDVRITWRRSGLVYKTGPELTLPAGILSPGDEVDAVVLVSDGEFEDLVETYSVTVRNLPPRITSVQLKPKPVTASESVLAEAVAVDQEEDEVHFAYQWLRNGTEIPDATAAVLEPGRVRRGDEVQVQVTAIDDGDNEGHQVLSAPIRVDNSAPEIESRPPFELASPDLYVYNIRAEDPDGDSPLRFELIEGPAGMRVDIVTGKLAWKIPSDAVGSHTVEVRVRDGYGGEAKQRYALEISLETPPAAPQ